MSCRCWLLSTFATWALAIALYFCWGNLLRMECWLVGLSIYVVHLLACISRIYRVSLEVEQ
jgi:hypothetical protein